ncbi:hypothetical protein [Brevibacterium moorei]|uniref:hypothetical protein n=1 Tax=Brevibacterium moorei TaxID=2968457 RepID=UPI00211C5AD7|nr:hypothetical protein [Brevibacterium sp. 68QC2CO]
MTWTNWMRETSGGASNADIARTTGRSYVTVSKWRTVTPSVESVIAFADAYGASRAEALVAAGYLRPDDLTGPPSRGLSAIPSDVLLDELRRRIRDLEDRAS